MTTQDEINRLDLAYQKLSGHQFRASGLITGREYAWSQFIKSGYGVKDLEETILWIKRGILLGKRFEGALKFRTLIGNLDTFEDEVATARAEKRNAKAPPSSKDRVVDMARPVVQKSLTTSNVEAKPIGHWIQKLRESVDQPLSNAE